VGVGLVLAAMDADGRRKEALVDVHGSTSVQGTVPVDRQLTQFRSSDMGGPFQQQSL
jgi:hypothetical protein